MICKKNCLIDNSCWYVFFVKIINQFFVIYNLKRVCDIHVQQCCEFVFVNVSNCVNLFCKQFENRFYKFVYYAEKNNESLYFHCIVTIFVRFFLNIIVLFLWYFREWYSKFTEIWKKKNQNYNQHIIAHFEKMINYFIQIKLPKIPPNSIWRTAFKSHHQTITTYDKNFGSQAWQALLQLLNKPSTSQNPSELNVQQLADCFCKSPRTARPTRPAKFARKTQQKIKTT